MITFTIQKFGTSPQEFVTRFFKQDWWILQDMFFDIGQKAHQFMKDTIHRKIRRAGSTGNLAESINFEGDTHGFTAWWGIGNLELLSQKAPYWRWLNYEIAKSGRSVPPSTAEYPTLKGHFEPNEMGRFVKETPRFPIYPTKPITPLNYIEETAVYLSDEFGKVSRKRKV